MSTPFLQMLRHPQGAKHKDGSSQELLNRCDAILSTRPLTSRDNYCIMAASYTEYAGEIGKATEGASEGISFVASR